jgi:peptide/nickel transport system substrate-binding protein
MKTIRWWRVILAVVPAMLAVSACGSSVSGSGTAGEKTTLSIAFPTDITTLNPWMTNTVPTDLSVISQIYQSLTIRQPDMSIEPLLATSWSNPDPKTWTFKLRTDVKYSNGDSFDSSVVKWNIEQVQDPTTKARIAPNWANIASVSTPDVSTVTITTKLPDATIPAMMSFFYFIDPKWAQAGKDLATTPMGTGPYELAKWTKNSLIQLKARDSYWGKKVSFKTVNYKILPDPSARIAALQTKAVDVISGFAPDDLDRIKAIPNVTAEPVSSTRTNILGMNTHNKPLDDIRVRQALNYAVDKETIVKTLFHGLTAPTAQLVTKQYVGYNAGLDLYQYDPDKAKQLLSEAGYPHGLTISLYYPNDRYMLANEVVQVVKEQLSKIDVTVELQAAPFTTWIDDMYAGKLKHLNYDAWAWPTLDGYNLLRYWAPGGSPFWSNAEFGDAIKQAGATADPSAHAAALESAVQIMRDQAPVVFLYATPQTYAHSKAVNWNPRPDDWIRAFDMTQG